LDENTRLTKRIIFIFFLVLHIDISPLKLEMKLIYMQSHVLDQLQ